ncbi:hypothetical protein D3C74_417020 [compost metagenome]
MIAKTQMPTIASQKSGIEAAIIEANEAMRSSTPLGFSAAAEPTMTASRMAMTMVNAASCSVAGKARSAMKAASSPVRIEVPKSRCRIPPK